jgi:hypothetical protein
MKRGIHTTSRERHLWGFYEIVEFQFTRSVCGLLFIAAVWFSRIQAYGLELGTAFRMGPGYFPLVLASVLILLGAIVIIQALPASNMSPWAILPGAACCSSCRLRSFRPDGARPRLCPVAFHDGAFGSFASAANEAGLTALMLSAA